MVIKDSGLRFMNSLRKYVMTRLSSRKNLIQKFYIIYRELNLIKAQRYTF